MALGDGQIISVSKGEHIVGSNPGQLDDASGLTSLQITRPVPARTIPFMSRRSSSASVNLLLIRDIKKFYSPESLHGVLIYMC